MASQDMQADVKVPFEFDEGQKRWRLDANMMSGITMPCWIAFVWRHGRRFEWTKYAHRICFLTVLAIFNTIVSIPDWLFMSRKIQAQQLPEEAVIIIGHPRTGTTHMHNLLSLDDRFTYVTTFQGGFPSSFLCMKKWLKPLFRPLLGSRRPMDNMQMDWDLPMEDEIAVNVLSAGISPYSVIPLISHMHLFRKFFTFEGASDFEFGAWLSAFRYFFKKVCLASGGSKPVLIKTPVHCARIRILKQQFPKAKFIYMHRNPYEVFQSSAHMSQAYFWLNALCTPTNADHVAYIIDHHNILLDAYLQDRSQLAPDELLELPFAKLDAQPLSTIEDVYRFLRLDIGPMLRNRIETYCATLSDYKKNDHNALSPAQRSAVVRHWRKAFDEFGYPV